VTDRALLRCVVAVVVGLTLVAPAQVHAQGNGRPKNPKTTTPSPTPSPAPTPAADSSTTSAPSISSTPVDAFASVSTFRQFGAWLEDASAPAPGEGYTTIGIGYWRMAGMSQTNVPMLGGGVGLTNRLGVSASVPFYRTNVAGTTARGMDDVYLGASYNILDPTLTLNEMGLSVGTVMEVLSSGAEGGRVHFAIPVSLELRRAPFRVYGSAGYFTRGAVFAGGAVEWAATPNWIVSGILTQSHSIKSDVTLDSLAVSPQRADVMASVARPVNANATVYMSAGRSLNSLEEGGTRLALSGGISLRFSAPRATP